MSSLLRLFNPETEETTEILVSEAEAQRAEIDLEFATQLLERFQSQGSPPLSETSQSSSSRYNGTKGTVEDATSCVVEAEASSVNGFKWSHEAILLLVEEFRKEQNNLFSGRVSQKKVWERIGTVLQGKGHIVTGPQCLSKFNGMKRTYKSIKDHNGKSGNSSRSWPYFELMESLLGEKPFIQPVATLSSTVTRPQLEAASTDLVPTQESPSSTRKRKASNDIAEAILESRRLAEESRERRHQERMIEKREFRNQMLQLMGQLIDKI